GEKYKQKVVVLVDEYDKPILDNITNKEKAIQMREILKNLYSVLKPLDEHIKFVMLTGVSKFSKVSIFSGLNQLKDITLDKDYSTLCGYTEKELLEVFKSEIEGENIEEIRTHCLRYI
ncbi:MAG: AAA family ATPase, partial [Candidatus Micrarchaeaceae archaeon]